MNDTARSQPSSAGAPPTALPRDRRHANRERLRRVLPAAALACLLCIASAASAQGAGPAPAIRLVVAGSVESKQVLGLSDLRALPVRRVEDQRQVRLGGSVPAEPAAVRSYTGVLLRDIVAAAKPTEDGRHELRRSVVVVTASDGYRVVFSWAELFLSPIGDGAIVVFERDGTPLAANEGPLAVVSLRDIQPGPRHVKWLEKIELRRID